MAAKAILEPAIPAERLRGWLLHAHKCRDRHDEAARSYDSVRYWLGVPTIVCSTIASASALASFSAQAGSAGGITAGIVSLIAAVLAALQTFLTILVVQRDTALQLRSTKRLSVSWSRR